MRLFSRHLDTVDFSDAMAGLASASVDAHLASCPRCRAERDRLRAGLDAVALGASMEADHLLPAAALERQRQSIRQRIGRLGAGARLLTFPAPAAARPLEPARADRRWVSAAAVAGLLVGLAVGRIQNGTVGSPGGGSSPLPLDGTPRAAVAPPAIELWRDDPLLSDIDAVLTRETRPEFEALDGLTPTSDDGR